MEDGHLRSAPEPLRTTVVVRNPHGLHMRPAAAFAKAAGRFRSTVTVRRNDRTANGKSFLTLLTLVAPPGAELVLEVAGEDASAAIELLAAVLGAASPEAAETPVG